jgi:heterotetrameric sarcosine oxidase gamma subunit
MADGSCARGCRLREIAGWSLVQVVAWPDAAASVVAALSEATGLDAPAAGGVLAPAGTIALFRVSPGQFWVLNDAGAAPDVRIAAAQGCVTPLTDGRRRFRIEGPKARDALAKVVALDLDPARFAVGRAALTGVLHVPVFLCRVDHDAYDIVMPRSFAVSLLEWLADAGREFGASLPVEAASLGAPTSAQFASAALIASSSARGSA